MSSVTIKKLKKIYNKQEVIHDIDLEINDREFVVFVGPSGCGKSTLLRMIAGLEEVTAGTISIGDKVVNDVSPSKRGVAMVFQTYALYPHMTVFDNMAFGLKQAKMRQNEIKERVTKIAETLQITDYLDRLPKNLSGGQRQRVAIGRAIVREPSLFLFDEPLSNLDAALRVQTRVEIAKLHKKINTTMIYVTHDQVEAMTLADKIVVLKDGYIEQVGKPIDLYQKPNNMFVAQFIGSPQINFFSRKELLQENLSIGDEITIGVRPEHLKPCAKEEALVSAKLDVVEQLGEYVLLHLHTENNTQFIVKSSHELPEADDSILYFNADLHQIHLFDTNTEKRITDKTL